MRVVILHQEVDGDRPDERDVLVQAAALEDALAALGHDARRLALGLDLARARDALARLAPDVVVNLVESVAGHGRLLHLAPALLAALGIPTTGASAEALLLTSQKVLAKRWMRAAGLPTPDWCEARGAGAPPREGLWIVKSVWEDASLGLGDDAVVDAARCDLRREIRLRAPLLGGEAFAEAYVDGRELNLALLAKDDGVEVLPAAEIRFDAFPPGKPRIVGYAAKWDEESFEYASTPRSFAFAPDAAPLLERLAALGRDCWMHFGLAGHARVDFRVDARGRPWILEVNANPCLAPDAGFAAAAARANLDLPALAARLLAAARASRER